MRVILRQGAALLACLALLYIGLLGLTLSLAQRPSQEPELDASLGNSIFRTEPKYIYLNRTPLRDSSEKIVLLGASNVDAGFNLTELRTLLHATATVHKLAIGGANLTEVREVIDLVQEVQSEEARRHEIFVLGIWYGMFGEDRLRWYTPDRSPGDTDIDIERYRYGFEWRTARGPITLVPWYYIDVAVTAIYPFLFLDQLSRDSLEWLSDKYHAQPKDLDTVVMTEDERGRMMNYWTGIMGPTRLSTFDEQFAVLEQSGDLILAEGSRLILVDLPLPKWHKQRSPYQSYYEDRRTQEVKRWMGRPGFVFLDMTDLDNDADFYDEVHPRPPCHNVMGKAIGRGVIPVAVSEWRGSWCGSWCGRWCGIWGAIAGKPGPMNSFGNRFGLRFHHFGLAVPSPDAAFRFLKALGYTLGAVVFDPLQLVNLAMCTHPEMPDVEVVWPSDVPSPIDRLLRRGGPTVYHLCYVAISPEHAIAAMEDYGFNVAAIGEPKRAALFGGQQVSFYNVDEIGLIEIIHGEPPQPDVIGGVYAIARDLREANAVIS